jgi:hypothetical protein
MQHDTGDARKGGWKAWLLMAACCVPMVAVIVLIALGWSLP